MRVSASIVIYNEDRDTLQRVLDNFLSIELDKELVIVDNSPISHFKKLCASYKDVKYIFSGNNIGFGAGHNLAFNNLNKKSNIHLIINPDTYFFGKDIESFTLWMYNNKEVSLAVPSVYFPDGKLQHTVRNIPSPLTLIKRRLNISGIFDKFIEKDEFRDTKFNDVREIPFAHGCFFAFKTDVYEKLKGFDERFFMYMEDVDICIRAKKFGRTVINPSYKIYHEYRKGSAKSLKLLYYHVVSAVKFFWKHK